MFDRNICQFVPHKKTQLDLQPLHFVLESKEISENDSDLSVYRIYCLLEGEAIFKNRKGEHKIKQGDVIMCLPGKRFSFYPAKGTKYAYVSYIGIRASMLTEKFHISENNCVFHGVTELLSVWKNALPVASSVSDLRIESVILYTYSVIGSKIINEPIPDLETNAATETKKFIDAHFSNPELTLATVCEKLSYSPKYISSVFTKQYKTTLSKYLNSIRIEHACSLIERGHTSIKTVAFMCGFNDPLYFSKVFKAYRKVSPREFIKSIQEK